MLTAPTVAFLFKLLFTNVKAHAVPKPSPTPVVLSVSKTPQPVKKAKLVLPQPTVAPDATKSPIPNSSVTPVATPFGTPSPAPTVKSTETPKPSATPPARSASITADAGGKESPTTKTNSILDKINQYRAGKGLSAVSENNETCNFASLRASEIAKDFNHSGFRNRINSNSLPYPSYAEVTENIAMTADPNEVVDLWIKSSSHEENMRKDTPYVCVRNSGSFYAYEGWRP